MNIDISAIVTPLVQLAGLVLVAMVTAAAPVVLSRAAAVLSKYGIKLDAQAQAQLSSNLDDVAARSVQAGVMASLGVIKDKGWDHVQTRSSIVNAATQYAIVKFPDALTKSGIDLTTTQGQQAVIDVITRAFPAGVAAAAASPVTPAVAPPASAQNPAAS